MKEITQEHVKSLFEYKDGELFWKVANSNRIKIGDIAGSLQTSGYHQIMINYNRYKTHRLIFLYFNGYFPKQLDHINRIKTDNRIENLRVVTNSQNRMNSKSYKNSTSKYKSVSWDKSRNKWLVQINFNNKRVYFDRFKNEIDAAQAYNKVAKKLFGEYVKLNGV